MSDEPDATTIHVRSPAGEGGEAPAEESFAERYPERRLLGEGGMGRVALVDDRLLRRSVALKCVREDRRDSEDARRRFLAEARLQAKLQHPNIVPIYEIGTDEDGHRFFTMRPIEGASLADVVKQLRAEDPSAPTRREILTALTRVALAIDYAHRNGVIHCDLKPGNIMLGAFGEVYVVDWGASREIGTDAPAPRGVLGSPAYMAPEQAEGRDHLIGPATDVFAFGAILFEVMTLERLADATETDAGVVGVSEDLAVICMRATAAAVEQRYASMREVHDALLSHLDGEADRQRHKNESAREAKAAEQIASSISGGPEELPLRQDAIRSIGRSLALNPGNEVAIRAMFDLIDSPMHTEPREVQELVQAAHFERIRRLGKVATFAYFGQLLHFPVFAFAGMREPIYLYGFYACMVLTGACAWWTHRQPSDTKVAVCLVLSCAGAAMLTGLLGPLLVMPMVLVANAAAYGPMLRGRGVFASIAVGAVALTTAFVLTKTGVLTDPYLFATDRLVVEAVLLDLGRSAEGILFLINLMTLSAGVLVPQLMSERVRAVEQRLFSQTWHFRQLLPTGAADR